jgi:2'-5' RNA ligase
MSRRSAVIVRIRLPPTLEHLRFHHDPVASAGVPAHVTVLFPFVRSDELTPAVRRALAGIASVVPPFDVRFGHPRRFPGVLWLSPEPEAPFRELTERVAAAFPDHPPYEGAHDEVVPHLTVGLGSERALGRLERAVDGCPAFGERVRALEVVAEDGTDRWHRRWRIPLGPTPQARSTAPHGSRHVGRSTGPTSPIRR